MIWKPRETGNIMWICITSLVQYINFHSGGKESNMDIMNKKETSFYSVMNQAKPIDSSLRIFSSVMKVLAFPSWYFLYSARWVETHLPRAVLSLYLVGTWQLPCFAMYCKSSFCGNGSDRDVSNCDQPIRRLLSYEAKLVYQTYKLFIPIRLSPSLRPTETNTL